MDGLEIGEKVTSIIANVLIIVYTAHQISRLK